MMGTDTLRCRSASKGADPPYLVVGSGQKPGMIVIGELIHGTVEGGGHHPAREVLHGTLKKRSVSQRSPVEGIAAFPIPVRKKETGSIKAS